MNTLRISKGKDIKLSVNGELLCFVIDFSAKEISDSYPITEFLSDVYVDQLPLATHYEIVLTAYSHLDERLLEGGNFDLCVELDDIKCVYKNCTLTKKERDAKPHKEIVDRYHIRATHLIKTEVLYEGD